MILLEHREDLRQNFVAFAGLFCVDVMSRKEQKDAKALPRSAGESLLQRMRRCQQGHEKRHWFELSS